MWMNTLDVFQKYMGTGIVMIWFLAAVIYLFLHEKDKVRRILFVYVPAILLLIFFNPLFARVFSTVVGDEIYFRICWLLPVIVVIAYAVICIFDDLQGVKQFVFLGIAILVLAASGKLVYSNSLYTRAENEYHVPQAVVELCDAIVVHGREVMALFPPELVLYVRQYSPVVLMPYGRDTMENYYSPFYYAMVGESIDMSELGPLAQEGHCHYVILREEKEILGNPQDYGWEEYGRIRGYIIFRNMNEPLEFVSVN